MKHVIVLAAACLMIAPLAWAQGAVGGRITSADARPLRRAQVTLAPVQSIGQLRLVASTNSQGGYEIRDVPPGTYRVRVTRSGYIPTFYGQRSAEQPGQTITIRANERLDGIDVALPRGAAIAGRVVDDVGLPLPGAVVEARVLRYVNGSRVPFPGGTATTDDLGAFRIGGLAPGAYLIAATSQELWINEKKETLGFALTYFSGGGPDAATVPLGPGQERTDIDFTMTASRAARISGVVLSASGAPAAGQRVSLARGSRESGYTVVAGARGTNASVDGAFEFRDVPPARYILQSRAQEEVAATYIDVSGEDIDGFVLRRQTGSNVSGIITTDSGEPPAFPAGRLRMETVATDLDRTLWTSRYLPSLVVRPDWTFEIANVAGPYLLRITGLPDDWLLKSVRLGGQEIVDVPLDVPVGHKDIAAVEIVLTNRTAGVAGSVVDRDGRPQPEATVVAFADDPDRWGPGSRFVKIARPDGSGRFAIGGLPEGAYRLAASEAIAEGQWDDREFLASIHLTAGLVRLTEGSTQTVTVSPRRP